MTTPSSSQPEDSRQDNWAAPVDRLKVGQISKDAININVNGRHLSSPIKGFGQLWQKTYHVRLAGAPVTPQQLIQVWKEKFASFWPKGYRFYGTGNAIAPGDVAVLNLAAPGGITGPGGSPLISTGIMVIYADEESFAFMTPEGHMFAGMITFSSFPESGDLLAQIQALVRANDPIYELSFRMGFGHKSEDAFWLQTLENLSAHFGSPAKAQLTRTLVDPKVQWSEAKNVWHNAAARTVIYLVLAPARWVKGLFNRKRTQES